MTRRTGGSQGFPSSVAPGRGTGRRKVDVELDRSAALLVRVWTEGRDGAFRARVTAVGAPGTDPSAAEFTVAVAATPGQLLDAVRQWLDEFLSAGT